MICPATGWSSSLMSIDLRSPCPPLSRITSSSASVTAYGHPRRRATTRIARSLYPARPAWQNGAEMFDRSRYGMSVGSSNRSRSGWRGSPMSRVRDYNIGRSFRLRHDPDRPAILRPRAAERSLRSRMSPPPHPRLPPPPLSAPPPLLYRPSLFTSASSSASRRHRRSASLWAPEAGAPEGRQPDHPPLPRRTCARPDPRRRHRLDPQRQREGRGAR